MNKTKSILNENNQALLAAIVDTSDDAIISKTLDGVITSWNRAAENMFGYTAAEAIGQHISLIIPIARLDEEKLILGNVSDGNKIDHFETVRVAKNGREVPVSLSVSPIMDTSGKVIGASKIARDITDSIAAAEKQAILASIIDTSDDTIVSKTLEGIITSWNKAAERMFGYTAKEAIGKHISIIIPPERLNEEDIIIGNIKKRKKIDHFQTVRVAKDGRKIPISLSVSPIISKNGKVIGASKIARDISDNILAAEKQATLAAIVNTSDDTIVSKTLEGVITSWNKAAERMFGYTEQEAIGQHISLIIPLDRLQEEEHIISEISRGRTVDHFQTIRLAKGGKEVPISVTVSPVADAGGKIVGASKIARDIGQQLEALHATRRYTERLEVINEVTKAISEDLDLNRILQKVTDATTRLTGAQFGAFFYNQVDENGESYMLYTLSGAPREAFEKFGMPRNTAIFHTTFSGEGVMRVDDVRKDPRYGKSAPHYGMPPGHLPVVSYLAVPVISRSGKVIGGLFFGHPEAGKFTAEHESMVVPIAAQAAIGIDNASLYEEVKVLNEKKDEFIGLASHELKTPLTSISGYLQIVSRLEMNQTTKKFVDKTLNQVNKLSLLVSDLLDVSKIEAGKLQLANQNFNIRKVVDESVELIQHSNENYTITVKSDILNLTVHGDPHRIEQVVNNLLTNAIKYSPGADSVEVSLTQESGKVKVSVKDFGLGIAADQLEHIFSRFYRVEGVSPNISGLGIGLYLSHEVVTRHNGDIWAESEPGKGSTFSFTLPL